MSTTKLLSVAEVAAYRAANVSDSSLQSINTPVSTINTPVSTINTPLSTINTPPTTKSTISISILNVDKSKYFKNIRHSHVISANIFSLPYNCPKRFLKYCLFYSLIVLMLCVVSVVIYGGVKVLEFGIVRDEYGHSFNVNGTCFCISNVKTSYDWQQTWKIWNLTVCDGVKPPGFTFTSQSGQRWVDAEDIKPCYTNKQCTRIFTSLTTNVIIDEAIYLYVGSVLIFLIATCGCIGSSIWLQTLPTKLNIKIWNVFVGPKDIQTHFESQWHQKLSAKQRFDYFMSYETRRLDIFLGSDGIMELLLKFYDDDNIENDEQTTEKSTLSKD